MTESWNISVGPRNPTGEMA